MASVTKDGVQLTFSDEVKKALPELVDLIVGTESMDNKEKQYWFDLLSGNQMTDKQVEKLYDILYTEKKKLAELEGKYQAEIKALNEKHLIEWQEFQKGQKAKKKK